MEVMKVLPCPAALLFLMAACSLEPSRGAKVLLMPAIVFDSHLRVFMRVAEALAERGHDPVLLLHEGRDVEAYLPGFRMQRYWGIFSTGNADAWVQEKIKRVFQGKLTSMEMFSFLEKYLENCDLVLGNSTLLQKLQHEHFDLLVVDPNEMCGLILAHILRIKYAVISTGFWFPAEIGATSPIAYVPEFNSLMTDRMSFFGRTWNLLVYVITRVATKLIILPKFERLMEKHRVEPKTSMLDLVHGTSLFFLCNDVVLDFPRPTLPHVIFIGGILAEPAKPLPVVSAGKLQAAIAHKPGELIGANLLLKSCCVLVPGCSRETGSTGGWEVAGKMWNSAVHSEVGFGFTVHVKWCV